jgi:DNA-binding XRE family transcriptional regulator
MLQGLSMICAAARMGSNVSVASVAATAHVSEATIRAFEHGRAWPRRVESVVNAYAALTGTNTQEIWKDAAGLMRE